MNSRAGLSFREDLGGGPSCRTDQQAAIRLTLKGLTIKITAHRLAEQLLAAAATPPCAAPSTARDKPAGPGGAWGKRLGGQRVFRGGGAAGDSKDAGLPSCDKTTRQRFTLPDVPFVFCARAIEQQRGCGGGFRRQG